VGARHARVAARGCAPALRALWTPLRVFGILILVLAIVGFTAWEKRAEIAEKILEGTVLPRLEVGRFPDTAVLLARETNADLVLLVKVDLAAGRAVNVDGRLRADPMWRPPGIPRTIFDSVTPEQALALIAGQALCDDVPPPDHTFQIVVSLGMKRRCIVAVPPVIDVFVGALLIAWKTPPKPALDIVPARYDLDTGRVSLLG
jgi:hypothetical protein